MGYYNEGTGKWAKYGTLPVKDAFWVFFRLCEECLIEGRTGFLCELCRKIIPHPNKNVIIDETVPK